MAEYLCHISFIVIKIKIVMVYYVAVSCLQINILTMMNIIVNYSKIIKISSGWTPWKLKTITEGVFTFRILIKNK